MRWRTGTPDRRGLNAYTHLIRHPGDPESTRSQSREVMDNRSNWRKELCSQELGSWRIRVRKHLRSYGPMSFQRLCVTMLDRDADKCVDTPIEQALFDLIETCVVQWSVGGPVAFRLNPSLE